MEASRIIDRLIAIQDKLGSVIDDIVSLKDEAAGFGGEIARVIPQNLQVNVDNLMDMYDGSSQSSISSLIEFMDNIPLGQLRAKSVVKSELDRNAKPAATARPIDTTPNVAAGPQSAVAQNESVTLESFYNDRFREQAKAPRHFSFDAIKESFNDKATELGANPITGIEGIFNNSHSIVNNNANRYTEAVINGPELEMSDWKKLAPGSNLDLLAMV